MIQRLFQQKAAFFNASPPTITFKFDPVPVGLTWTGTIALTVEENQDLQGIVWTLFRNGTPFLTWQEYGVASDVQATGAETLVLVGAYQGTAATIPQFRIRATWTGWSDDSSSAPIALPWVSGSNRGLVHVYNASGNTLAVATDPQPKNVKRALVNIAAPSTFANLMSPPAAGSVYRIWELGLQLTAGSIASDTGGARWLTGSVGTTGSGITIAQVQLTTVPGSVSSEYAHYPLHGYTLAAGETLQAFTSAYGGANTNAVATCVYDVV